MKVHKLIHFRVSKNSSKKTTRRTRRAPDLEMARYGDCTSECRQLNNQGKKRHGSTVRGAVRCGRAGLEVGELNAEIGENQNECN